jgi:hypothetical protein
VYSRIQLHAQLDFGTEEVEYEAVQRMLTPELDYLTFSAAFCSLRVLRVRPQELECTGNQEKWYETVH